MSSNNDKQREEKEKQQKARDDAEKAKAKAGGSLLRIAPAEESDVAPKSIKEEASQTQEDTANPANSGDEELAVAGPGMTPGLDGKIPVASKVKEEPIYRAVEENHAQKRRSIMMILAVLGVAVVIAVILGVYSSTGSSDEEVPIISANEENSSDLPDSGGPPVKEELVAHLQYQQKDADMDFPHMTEVKKFRNQVTGEMRVTGSMKIMHCRPNACMIKDDGIAPCRMSSVEGVAWFDHEQATSGECCLMPHCTPEQLENGEQCGEQCQR
jgi:hypothetical protein